jgi:plasmid stabilization system protein ParE
LIRKVFWSENALKDLQGILEYIASESIQNARLVASRIDKSVNLLAATPFGKPGRMRGTYEAVVPRTPFIIAYMLDGNKTLSIARVIHGARDWREGEWPS